MELEMNNYTIAIGISHIKNDILYGVYDKNNLQYVFIPEQLSNIKLENIDTYKIVDQRMVCKK